MASDPIRDREHQIKLLEEELKILSKVNKYQAQQIIQFGNLNKKLGSIDKNISRGLGSVFSRQRTQYELSRQNPLSRSILESMLGSITDSENRQIRALGFGRNLRNIMGNKGRQFQDGIGGYSEQLESELGFRERGFTEVTKSMRDLSVRLRLTGQNEAKLVDALRENHVAAGVTVEGLDKLSLNLTKAYKEYGVKADILVHAISNLGNDLDLNLLGAGEQVKGAILDLTKQYGDGSEGFIKHFIELSTDVENYHNVIQGGIQEQLKILLDANSTQEEASKALEEAMLDIGNKMNEQMKILQSQGIPQQFSLQVLKQIYGDLGSISIPLMNMEKMTAAQGKDMHEANESFTAYFKEFPSVIQRYLTEIFGGNLTEQVELLKSTEAGVWTIANVMMSTSLVKLGVQSVGSAMAMKKVGLKGLLLKSIGVEAAGTAAGTAVARTGMAAAGTSIAPIVLTTLGILAAAAGTYYILDKIESKKVSNKLKKHLEELNTQKASELETSINTPVGIQQNSYDAITTALNKRNNELLQQMLTELKRGNSTALMPIQVNLGGM